MKFLLRWGSRLGLLFGVPALLASSNLASLAAAYLWTGYVIWCARETLWRHARRLWAFTSFRSFVPGGSIRLGRLKGDTL